MFIPSISVPMGICRIRANTGAEFTTDRWDLEAHLPGVSTGLKHSAQDEKRLTFSLTSSDFTNQGVLKSRGWSLTIQKVNKNFTQVLTLKAAQNWCRLKQKAVSSVLLDMQAEVWTMTSNAAFKRRAGWWKVPSDQESMIHFVNVNRCLAARLLRWPPGWQISQKMFQGWQGYFQDICS